MWVLPLLYLKTSFPESYEDIKADEENFGSNILFAGPPKPKTDTASVPHQREK